MASSQQFSLRWNNYFGHITKAFETLRSDDSLVDVTLSCEGKKIHAHKMLLSACSSYFKDIFKENPCQHPVVILKNVKFDDLQALVDFMYQGEVNVVQDQLTSFLTTAELLAVQGLTDGTMKDVDEVNEAACEESLEKTRLYLSEPLASPEQNNKKRRHTKSQHDVNENKSKKSHIPDDDECSFIPVNHPSLKSELPDYIEQSIEQTEEHDNIDDNGENSCDYVQDEIDLKQTLDTTELANLYSTDGGVTTNADMSDVIVSPGTSDSIQQDSALQDYGKHIRLRHVRCAKKQKSNNSLDAALYSETKDEQQMRQYATAPLFFPTNYPCTQCMKVFKHPDSLRQHSQAHKGETLCPICQVLLSRKYELRVHMKKIHKIIQNH